VYSKLAYAGKDAYLADRERASAILDVLCYMTDDVYTA
jgi:hypothetical protein